MCEQLIVDGVSVSADTLPEWRKGRTGIAAELADFLTDWFSNSSTMELQTSGSTGKPKIMRATKAAMRAGAAMSCEYFGLTAANRVLLCLPMRYIAGKMMVVRAIVSGATLQLQEPCSTPLANLTSPVDFVPLVPMQVASTLKQENGKQQLALAKSILLGGGFIDPALAEQLQHIPGRIYASYGMTETLSHIALRHVNGPKRSDWYTPLRGVSLSISADDTLVITAPHLGVTELVTNDLAEIRADGTFRILGRRDAVINSGGIKIQAEEIEQRLSAGTGLTLLAVPAPDSILGQCVALLWEGEDDAESSLQAAIQSLPAYHRPRIVRHLPLLPRTATGKLSRAQAIELLR